MQLLPTIVNLSSSWKINVVISSEGFRIIEAGLDLPSSRLTSRLNKGATLTYGEMVFGHHIFLTHIH